MKKLFLALCAMILVAQPSIKADSQVCVNMPEEAKILGLGLSLSTAFVFATLTGLGCLNTVDSIKNYVEFKINKCRVSEEFKRMVISSGLTALGVAATVGSLLIAGKIGNSLNK